MSHFPVLSLVACLASTSAFALDQGDYRFNGFGTAGITRLGGEDAGRSYGVNGQTNDSWRGDQLSKLGGQFQYGLTDTLGVTLQVTAKPEQDKWKANLEWAYLSWQPTDGLVLRAGRLRAPIYMYSETLDVGFTYPWLRLPDEVYSQIQLNNYEGADALYTLPLSFGSVNFQLAGGQSVNRKFFFADGLYDTDYKKIFAANVSLATNDFGTVRIGYTEASPKTDLTPQITDLFGVNGPVTFAQYEDQKGKFTSVGYQYDNGTWLTANEWTRRNTEADGQSNTEAFYLMGGRRFDDFLPHVTYAQLDAEAVRQSSWTFGLNYSVTPAVTVKSEYKRVDTKGQYAGVFVENAQEIYDHAISGATGGLAGTPARNFDGDIISVGVDFVF